MPSVFDFAAHIKSRIASGDRMRLLKLVYYVQAWSLVERDRPAFPERIEAWKNGPVTKALWTDLEHSQGRQLNKAVQLAPVDAAFADDVVSRYAEMTPIELSALTHLEEPWMAARGDLRPGDHGDGEITQAAMKTYYSRMLEEAREDAERAREARKSPIYYGIDEVSRALGL